MDALKGLLQGKWLGHPLHPALVHLPTALWPAALLFDLLSRTDLAGRSCSRFRITPSSRLDCGAGGALAGLADWADIKPKSRLRSSGWCTWCST